MTELARNTGLGVRAALWFAQALVGLPFILFGFMKLTTPIAKLSTIMPWAGEYSEAFVRMMGLIDVAGGIGILLPAITRIRPATTVWAALACALLQVCAIVFHVSRGEAAMTPMNVLFLISALFVVWGRQTKAAVLPRR